MCQQHVCSTDMCQQQGCSTYTCQQHGCSTDTCQQHGCYTDTCQQHVCSTDMSATRLQYWHVSATRLQQGVTPMCSTLPQFTDKSDAGSLFKELTAGTTNTKESHNRVDVWTDWFLYHDASNNEAVSKVPEADILSRTLSVNVCRETVRLRYKNRSFL
jgi:hypothetical protein